MGKYSIEESTLTAMGDKLRSLRGISAKMTTDEMQGHLDTELANITAALSALTEKGVEVPEGATSDSLAELIAGIEAGEDVTVGEGSITFSENSNRFPADVAILDGVLPSLLIVYHPESLRSGEMDSYSYSFPGSAVIKLLDTTPVTTGYKDAAGLTISTYRFSNNGDVMMPSVTESVSVASGGIRLYNLNYAMSTSGTTYNYIAVWGLNFA